MSGAPDLPEPPDLRPRGGVGRRLRTYFFTGLVVLAPVGVTIGILVWGFRLVDGILGDLVRETLGVYVPGAGLVVLLVGVMVIGFVVRLAAGRQLLYWWNLALSRFPLTGRIYHSASQIVQTIVGEQKRIFQRPVLIPYPTDGLWAVAFVTNDRSPPLPGVEEPCVNVFVPTTPNPTSGFLLIVPTSRLRPLDVTIEEAMKLVISAGAVAPTAERAVSRGLDLDHLLRDARGTRKRRD